MPVNGWHAQQFGYPYPPMAGGSDQAAPPSGTGEPQGQGGGNELHEQFISSAPEHLRDAARELVPLWDKGVQERFTESANYKKQWEPYESLGLNDIEPNEIKELLDFREIVQDEEKFRQWYEDIGNLMGVDSDDDDDDDEDAAIPKEMQQFMREFQQFRQEQTQREQEREQQEAFQQTAQQVRQQLDEIKRNNPDVDEKVEETICTLALKYDGEDAIKKGFADYQALMSDAEKRVFKNKTGTDLPGTSVSGGSAATQAEPVTSFEQANRIARERMRNSV